MWRPKKSRGPDVEAIIFLPVVVAVESKRTADGALDKVAQIISYAEDKSYDAVILRLEENPEEAKSYDKLVNLIGRYGVGVVVGGDPYAPLSGSEEVLLKARMKLRPSPALELHSEMQQVVVSTEDVGKLVEKLSLYRKFFEEDDGIEGS